MQDISAILFKKEMSDLTTMAPIVAPQPTPTTSPIGKEQTTESKPMLFIQQTSDRSGSITELRKIVIDKNPVKVVEIPGNDHMYSDIHKLKDIIESWHQNIGS